MAGCEGLTFHGVTRSAWTSIKRAASTYGVGGGDAGSGSAQGFSFSWRYNEGAKTLHIQCTDAPGLVPCSEINAKLQSEVQSVIFATSEEGGETLLA